VRLPLHEAAPEIGLNPGGRLIALLGRLCEQLHHDCRELGGHCRDPLFGRCRLPSNMTVDPLERVSGGKGQRCGEHLVEGNAERVQIAACVDRSIHPACLFRRHVVQRARNDLRRVGILVLARGTGRVAESREPGIAARSVHQDIRRLDVLVDEAAFMHSSDRRGNSDGDPQKGHRVQRVA